MKNYIIIMICFVFLNSCCNRRAEKGILITVKDKSTGNPIENIEVHIRDVQNHSVEGLVDYGNTNSNGQVKLKLSEKCSDYLEIRSGGNSEYYSGDYNGDTHTTRTLPKRLLFTLNTSNG